ncbi:hypothetical protein FKM82_009582, partial [Ascaphus truei]
EFTGSSGSENCWGCKSRDRGRKSYREKRGTGCSEGKPLQTDSKRKRQEAERAEGRRRVERRSEEDNAKRNDRQEKKEGDVHERKISPSRDMSTVRFEPKAEASEVNG